MATLTVQTIIQAGLEPAALAAAAAGGDQFANTGREMVEINNASVGDITVTFNSQAPCSQGFDHNEAVVVTAAERRLIGPFPTGRFNDASGFVLITYSGVTTLTIGVYKLPT